VAVHPVSVKIANLLTLPVTPLKEAFNEFHLIQRLLGSGGSVPKMALRESIFGNFYRRNASSDRLRLKSKVVDRFKGYLTVQIALF
jgi:hypothetical protein